MELAMNHLQLANAELTKALHVLAPDHVVMQRIADVKNQIRQIMVDLEEKTEVA